MPNIFENSDNVFPFTKLIFNLVKKRSFEFKNQEVIYLTTIYPRIQSPKNSSLW